MSAAYALAQSARPSSCGDAFRDPTANEECDDGNVTKLDGCDNQCKFEQDHRIISMKIQFGTDAFCTANALGGAIGSATLTGKLVRDKFQADIDGTVKDGTLSALFTFNGDLAGAAGPVTVGNFSGAPHTHAPPYDGVSDLDWWYQPNAASIDATRTALATLTGTYTAGTLEATGRLNLVTTVGGYVANLAVSAAKIKMPIGSANVPLTSAGATPPGHIAGERLLPTLTSFSVAGGTVAAPTAQMCGNIAASSFDIPVPADFLPGGANACNEGYAATNRFIDIFALGCHVTGLNVSAIKATQPDQVDPSASPPEPAAPIPSSRTQPRSASRAARTRTAPSWRSRHA